MNRELFGTDGIRGVADEWPLDQEGVEQIGRAVGVHFAEAGEVVTLGYDTRESSPRLAEALMSGLRSVGVDVKELGVAPTPAVAFATRESEARAGVMITASHNPYRDNGIKVFSAKGGKLPDRTEAAINELIGSDIPCRGSRGRIFSARGHVDAYRNFLVGSLTESLDGTEYALDTANGATSGIAGMVFRAAGSKVITHFNAPTGKNINYHCGATDTQALQDIVRYTGYEGGFAFDGDGDRLMVVDEKGQVMHGDHIMYLLARDKDLPKVVATEMSNMGFEKALTEEGRKLHRTAVGDRYVLAGMEETGALLGGEQSGHIILAEHLQTGDGILAALAFAAAARKSGKSFSAIRDELKLLPQIIVNIDTGYKQLVGHEAVQSFVAMHNETLTGSGRVNVRASGTEQRVRVMVESEDAEERARNIAQGVGSILAQLAK